MTSDEKETIRRLKSKIAQFKGQITRAAKYASEQADQVLVELEGVQLRLDVLQKSLVSYNETRLELSLITDEDKEDFDDDDVEERCFSVMSQLRAILRVAEASDDCAKKKSASTSSTSSNVTNRLAPVDIATFDGKDITLFSSFIEMFRADIDRDSSLTDVQKLYYLKKYLRGESLALVDSLPLTNESYSQGIKLLTNRYDNKCLLITHHINALVDHQPISKGTASELRNLVSMVRQHIGALQTLGQQIKHWDMLIICIMSRKLDSLSRRMYIGDRDSSKLPTLEDFLQFLEKRAMSFEESQIANGFESSFGYEGITHHSAHRLRQQKSLRKHRAALDGALRFDPEPYSKNLELNTPGKVHCKVAGGVAPTVQWFSNTSDPLPDGVSSANGTLLVVSAEKRHAGRYTCTAADGDNSISAEIHLSVVVSPKFLEPLPGAELHVAEKQAVVLNCRATGDPPPTTHWDRNLTALTPLLEDVDVEGGLNASNARILVLNNGSVWLRSVRGDDANRYGCTAGSAAGLARAELQLIVHPEGSLDADAGGAGRAVSVAAGVALAYMVLVAALMFYCRRRRQQRRLRGEKIELEMAEGREKLVEEGEEKPRANGAPRNGRLPHDKDSGADTSEVSGASRASRRGFEHLTAPRTLLTEQITLGRGEFGEVFLARLDVSELKKLRAPAASAAPRPKPVLVKALTTKDETVCQEFRRQLELFGRVRHEHVARLLALCSDGDPHLMVLEHTEWGDLKSFLTATRSPEQSSQYSGRAAPLSAQHSALLASQLAAGAAALAAHRLTHRDIAARNCTVSPQLRLKLSLAALSRGPDAKHYYKLHDQVIPLRWLPAEALEGEYSAKSDAYMFAATVWEIYTKAELPFSKLNDVSVLERLRAGSLEWAVPDSMPEALANLLKRCWSVSPAARPQFEDICAEVNAVLQKVTSDTDAPRETEP